ncbi:hypothetical protein CKO50_02130 [Pseudoalteromonas sp. HM-SA03]|nr:hypothetical protein CKO50_02130 [Pseudoalteromonas sp. HM-SA03]
MSVTLIKSADTELNNSVTFVLEIRIKTRNNKLLSKVSAYDLHCLRNQVLSQVKLELYAYLIRPVYCIAKYSKKVNKK